MSVDPINEVITECRKFLKNEVRDYALQADFTKDTDWMKKVWRTSSQLDLPLLLIPQNFNGAGFSPYSCAVLLDIMASECACMASVFAFHFTGCSTVLNADKDQQESLFSFIVNEDQSSPAVLSAVFPSDTNENELFMEEKNNLMTLNGISPLAGNASIADYFILFVEEPDNSGGHITCVILSKDAPGLSMGKAADFPGLKANDFAPVVLNNVTIEKQAVIGKRKQAKKILEDAQQLFFRFIGATAMGVARSAYEKAETYARNRYQSGKMIIHHQEIQRMLGSMRMKIAAGTAGYTKSFDENNLTVPFSTPDSGLVKVFCTDAALEIVLDAIQIHGGYGYMHEYGLEKSMRDAKVLQLLGGRNPKIQINSIAGELQYDG